MEEFSSGILNLFRDMEISILKIWDPDIEAENVRVDIAVEQTSSIELVGSGSQDPPVCENDY